MTCTTTSPNGVKVSRFTTSRGWDEYTIMVGNVAGCSIEEACETLHSRYREALDEHGLSTTTQLFTRLHVSDIANQKNAIKNSRLYSILDHGAVSMIEQAPVYDGPISLHTYHVVPGGGHPKPVHPRYENAWGRLPPKALVPLNHDPLHWRNGSLVEGATYRMLWLANYDGRGRFDGAAQTKDAFDVMATQLGSHEMTLRQNTVRTWIYVRDIDNHYRDMVRSRLELFEQIGLTDQTRYIASTGIEGKGKETSSLVSADSLSIGGLKEKQIVPMEAPDNMPPTIRYGVTFERGLRVRFGDRSHLYVSGTASIDRDGAVMHVGDARLQAKRSLDNVSALLAPQDACLGDLQYLYIYVRDPASCDAIRSVVEQRVPECVPVVYLRGAVCRPEWLVEMEGEARIPDSAEFPCFL